MINWEDLSQKTRDYFDSRFANHGMDGETAFNHPKIIPIKSREELDSDAIEQLLREKEISHVMSQANFPELASDYNNIVLESKELNRSRSDENMTQEEIDIAQEDLLEDIDQLNDKLSLVEDLPEILTASTSLGVVFTLNDASNKIKDGTLQLEEAPQYVLRKSGNRVFKAAIIGTCLTSGAPVLVAAAGAYLIHKNKSIFSAFIDIAEKTFNFFSNKELQLGEYKPKVNYKVLDNIKLSKKYDEIDSILKKIRSKIEIVTEDDYEEVLDLFVDEMMKEADEDFDKLSDISNIINNPYFINHVVDNLTFIEVFTFDDIISPKENSNKKYLFDYDYFKLFLMTKYHTKHDYYLQKINKKKYTIHVNTNFIIANKDCEELKNAFDRNFNSLNQYKEFHIIKQSKIDLKKTKKHLHKILSETKHVHIPRAKIKLAKMDYPEDGVYPWTYEDVFYEDETDSYKLEGVGRYSKMIQNDFEKNIDALNQQGFYFNQKHNKFYFNFKESDKEYKYEFKPNDINDFVLSDIINLFWARLYFGTRLKKVGIVH